jgi:hypothetical protein
LPDPNRFHQEFPGVVVVVIDDMTRLREGHRREDA